MKLKNILITCIMGATSLNAVATITGRWRGELAMGPAKLPLVLSFVSGEDGDIHASMDSPMQNVTGIPLDILFLSPDSVSVECKRLGTVYCGRITDGKKIEGTFSQRGIKLPLTLTEEQPLSERRPQTPQPPFPYTESDTMFVSADGTRLAGTLTIPSATNGKEETPVVVMVTGSGPQNRDEEIFEHRPFAVIADYLARNGIASFRYDDRGVASSEGDYQAATIDTFLTDAKSALRFVRSTGMFGNAGIIGHSEGATLAVLIAASEEAPDFIVSLAGMVVPAKETLLAQNRRQLEKYPFSDLQKESAMTLIEQLYDQIIAQVHNGETSPIDVDRIVREHSLDVPPAVLASVRQNNSTRNAYFDSLLSLDPTEALKDIGCPVLAINGNQDTQVDAEANLNAFSKNVKNVDVRYMSGLNHLLQHASTGDSSEYGDIAETISPEVLDIITAFITRR